MLMFVRRWLIRTGLFRMACRADGGALDACCSGPQGGGGGQQPGPLWAAGAENAATAALLSHYLAAKL